MLHLSQVSVVSLHTNEPCVVRVANCLSSFANTRFREDSIDVCLYRRHAEHELFTDLTVGKSFSDEREEFECAGSETVASSMS